MTFSTPGWLSHESLERGNHMNQEIGRRVLAEFGYDLSVETHPYGKRTAIYICAKRANEEAVRLMSYTKFYQTPERKFRTFLQQTFGTGGESVPESEGDA